MICIIHWIEKSCSINSTLDFIFARVEWKKKLLTRWTILCLFTLENVLEKTREIISVNRSKKGKLYFGFYTKIDSCFSGNYFSTNRIFFTDHSITGLYTSRWFVRLTLWSIWFSRCSSLCMFVLQFAFRSAQPLSLFVFFCACCCCMYELRDLFEFDFFSLIYSPRQINPSTKNCDFVEVTYQMASTLMQTMLLHARANRHLVPDAIFKNKAYDEWLSSMHSQWYAPLFIHIFFVGFP